MRGRTRFDILANNIHALAPNTELNKRERKKPRMCWACQKDKSTYQGLIRIQAGLHKFVCKDCLDAKDAKKELKETT
jgi:hypothetical protein